MKKIQLKTVNLITIIPLYCVHFLVVSHICSALSHIVSSDSWVLINLFAKVGNSQNYNYFRSKQPWVLFFHFQKVLSLEKGHKIVIIVSAWDTETLVNQSIFWKNWTIRISILWRCSNVVVQKLTKLCKHVCGNGTWNVLVWTDIIFSRKCHTYKVCDHKYFAYRILVFT